MNNENLPMMLSANDLQAMGFTRTMVYTLFKRRDFPTIKIGNRLFVQRDKFFAWLDKLDGEIVNDEKVGIPTIDERSEK